MNAKLLIAALSSIVLVPGCAVDYDDHDDFADEDVADVSVPEHSAQDHPARCASNSSRRDGRPTTP